MILDYPTPHAKASIIISYAVLTIIYTINLLTLILTVLNSATNYLITYWIILCVPFIISYFVALYLYMKRCCGWGKYVNMYHCCELRVFDKNPTPILSIIQLISQAIFNIDLFKTLHLNKASDFKIRYSASIHSFLLLLGSIISALFIPIYIILLLLSPFTRKYLHNGEAKWIVRFQLAHILPSCLTHFNVLCSNDTDFNYYAFIGFISCFAYIIIATTSRDLLCYHHTIWNRDSKHNCNCISYPCFLLDLILSFIIYSGSSSGWIITNYWVTVPMLIKPRYFIEYKKWITNSETSIYHYFKNYAKSFDKELTMVHCFIISQDTHRLFHHYRDWMKLNKIQKYMTIFRLGGRKLVMGLSGYMLFIISSIITYSFPFIWIYMNGVTNSFCLMLFCMYVIFLVNVITKEDLCRDVMSINWILILAINFVHANSAQAQMTFRLNYYAYITYNEIIGAFGADIGMIIVSHIFNVTLPIHYTNDMPFWLSQSIDLSENRKSFIMNQYPLKQLAQKFIYCLGLKNKISLSLYSAIQKLKSGNKFEFQPFCYLWISKPSQMYRPATYQTIPDLKKTRFAV